MDGEENYLLGANDAEIERLGIQHRAWREIVLKTWRDAGITSGSRVLDLGAGPGHATVDLAEIVGPGGEVVAVERAEHFVQALKEIVRERSLSNVRIEQLDVATSELPAGDFDFVWCRLVAMFISNRRALIKKVARALGRNGTVIFHEFARHDTWQFSPPLTTQRLFVQYLTERLGNSGVALELPPLLVENGFSIRSVKPHIFCLRPNDPMWEWPNAFMASTMAQRDQLDARQGQFVDRLRRELAQAKANPNAVMMTPLMLEIVAAKTG